MTRNPELLSINCTSCGAGLDVLGGGRVVVQICPYCGAELDALDNYRTLRQFDGLERPKSPLAIGMQGTLFGAEFTIIGLVEHTERWRGRVYKWIDHQLFSPTHGYAWLTLENGHLVFSRRYRGPGWISERRVETSEHPPTTTSGGEAYRYYETTTSAVTYVEGEFTWRPTLGEKTVTISAMSNGAMLGFSQTGSERETYRSVYVPKADAEAAFGVSLDLKPYRTHPLQPFIKGRNYDFLVFASLVFCVLCLVMAMAFTSRSGQPVLMNHQISAARLPAEIEIPLKADSKLTQISFQSDVENSWIYLDIELIDPEGQPVFEAGRTIEFYSGRDADGNWREGSRFADLSFRPEKTGTYTLALDVPEQGLWQGRGVGRVPNKPFNQIRINAQTGLSSGLWLFGLGGLFGLLFLFHAGRQWLHQRARWSGTDWVDED
ncbi:DUF4178 domain-containing protein [Ruegeria halocynthiae]|uniref:DUF4178 domain-containing protein n=1 Tax=Ruegeria halocynthiae TaxID=985054 RepID=UPI000562C27A|nr:DUF4178 domain-containing protein [Ruegeria halocynthiae]